MSPPSSAAVFVLLLAYRWMASDPERKVLLMEHVCCVSKQLRERFPWGFNGAEGAICCPQHFGDHYAGSTSLEESGVVRPGVQLRYFPSPGLEHRVQI